MDSDANSDTSRPPTPVSKPNKQRLARRLSYGSTSTAMTRAQPGADARRQSLLDIALQMEREPDFLPPPPKARKLLESFKVEISPGGRMLTTGNLLLDQSPHGSLRKATSPPPSIFLGAVEKVAAADIDEDDVDVLMAGQGPHIRRWLQPHASASSQANREATLQLDTSLLAPQLETSKNDEDFEKVKNQSVQTEPGSDMDSDFDDDFDVDVNTRRIDRDIPMNEQLDAPLRQAIDHLESAMDSAQDNILGENRVFNWTQDYTSFQGTRGQFCESPGPIREFNVVSHPFLAIWDRPIIEHIVKETNRYAEQVIGSQELPPKSRLRDWRPTDVDEIYRLFAIFIYMGLDSRSNQMEYWMTTTVLEMPKFRQLMTYSRYILLNKFLHFVDNFDSSQSSLQNDGTELSPKLKKMAPIIHHLNSKFETLYVPDQNISIDESLTLFKGRLSWIQAIRSKAARFGIKSFELCESRTGYMYRFKIYTGKETSNTSLDRASTDLGGKATQVVLDLIKGFEGKGYCLTMDNFYNSPALARHLKSIGIDCLGTLRANRRHVPEDVSKLRQNVPKGTIVARHCGDVSVLAWKDVKIVNMISTYHDNSTTEGTRAGSILQKPICVKDYNRSMGGIDLKDQMLSMYLMERKRCLKWYVKMFKRLLNVSVLNAYIMCKHSRNAMNMDPIDHRGYRYELAEFLSCLGHQQISQPVPSYAEIRLRRDIPHNPFVTHGRTGKRRRCVRCSAKGVEKRVPSGCTVCDVGLCFNGICWPEYHSLSNLKDKD